MHYLPYCSVTLQWDGTQWIAKCGFLLGCHTVGKTRSEALGNLKPFIQQALGYLPKLEVWIVTDLYGRWREVEPN